MDTDLSTLDANLDDVGADGYLIDADGSDSNQRYLAGFGAPDPFQTLYTPAGTHLLVSALEYGRAESESRADTVTRLGEYDFMQRRARDGEVAATAQVLAEFLADHDVASVSTPPRFPLGLADALRDRGVEVAAETDDVVEAIRAVKTEAEVDHVRTAQRANERAMRAAERLIRESTAEGDTLTLDGEPLTAERVREEIEITLLRDGCSLNETIVACGADAADPHDRGSGPLAPDEMIVVDIFPRDKETKYHADMTRTFVKGDPTEEMRRRYEVTDEARAAAIDAVEPGVTGADVHEVVCDVYEEAGYPTLRSDENTSTGFIHGTGHGVGLDIHELPTVSSGGGTLEPGNVITIEPGLYDPEVGGVRIEDLVVVTEDGCENLTDYPREFVLE